MLEKFLLNAPGFLPLGRAFSWDPQLLSLFLFAHGLIVVACLTIPFALWYFARRRADMKYRGIVVLFGFFVLAIGITHGNELWSLWTPVYWLQAFCAMIAGLLATISAVLIWRALRAALSLPTNAQLQQAYQALSQRHRQLMESESRYRLLLDTAGEGIWMIDREGITTYANQAITEMLRYDGSLTERRFLDFVLEDDIAEAEAHLQQRWQGMRDRHELRFRRADGTVMHAIVYAAPFPDDKGEFAGSLKLITDITDLVETDRKLQALNRELEQRVAERTTALDASNRDLAQEIVVREYMQQELRAGNERLNHYLQQLEERNADMLRLNALSNQLHRCDEHRDLVRVLEHGCGELFAAQGGALLQLRDGELQLLDTAWGSAIGLDLAAMPDLLSAVKNDRMFPDSVEQQHLALASIQYGDYLMCVPLLSRGRELGALLLLREQPFWSGDSILDEKIEQTLQSMADQTALALANLSLREQLREQSFSDPLTGLYNRRYLYQQMTRLVALWERSRESFAVILIDVDFFKSFNDRFGHDVGDAVLIGIAQLLQEHVRKSDMAGRLGGEEFVVLMAGAEQRLAQERAESLRAAVKGLEIPGADAQVTISAGVALFPQHGDDVYALMRAADRALYQSKHLGRDRITLAEHEVSAT